MSFFKLADRKVVFAVSMFVAASSAAPASAQGFLEQLFGGGSAQPSQPSYGYQPQQPASPDLTYAPLRAFHPRKIVIHTEPIPQRQKTTDLWHDKTLHPGDAIMMKDGLHIYSGPEAAKHTAKQFVPLDQARHVAAKERSALVAMDTTRNDPLRTTLAPDTIASGRSAAVGTPINKGIRITDARGASVRYVGP